MNCPLCAQDDCIETYTEQNTFSLTKRPELGELTVDGLHRSRCVKCGCVYVTLEQMEVNHGLIQEVIKRKFN